LVFPKHVQQLVAENHLRWDSLGEFCALGESLLFYATTSGNTKARILGQAAEVATQKILDNDRSPSRRVGEADNRESHFYFAMYWAEALANQSEDDGISSKCREIFGKLKDEEKQIVTELRGVQGCEVDIGGYYRPDAVKIAKVMRPSNTLNSIIDAI
ncbi:MAG: NADP-dependent isocitrate dehydrogenase, partial [Burkholderiales bacterium]|nr:NADP-dependent isocitrate dehydrogenase [Burkholderiales bacterium]